MKITWSILASLLLASPTFAAKIAIIDSGTDFQHQMTSKNVWVNTADTADNGTDDDQNGFVDDVLGWNFAEDNNQVIDYKYVGTFGPDVYKFFEVQGRILEGRATPEDIEWMKQKREDQEFIKELMKFGNFVHGTHVTGISINMAKGNKAMAIKLIPTEAGMAARWIQERQNGSVDAYNDELNKLLIRFALQQLAKQQSKLLVNVGNYVNTRQAHVANGSFGTGINQAKMIVGQLFQMFLKREPTEEELNDLCKTLLDTMVEEAKAFVNASPGTLFVFAAGNDGNDNDTMPTSPANVKTDNTMSVAATVNRNKLASFSSYGQQMVDVAAPGVGISSAIPGHPNEKNMLKLSGTSQAAPYVANAAAQVRDGNPKLTPAEIRQVLMGTVDKKAFLTSKVASGGIVNPTRAARAALLSRKMDLNAAIDSARKAVRDIPAGVQMMSDEDMEKNLYVLPLASTLN